MSEKLRLNPKFMKIANNIKMIDNYDSRLNVTSIIYLFCSKRLEYKKNQDRVKTCKSYEKDISI